MTSRASALSRPRPDLWATRGEIPRADPAIPRAYPAELAHAGEAREQGEVKAATSKNNGSLLLVPQEVSSDSCEDHSPVLGVPVPASRSSTWLARVDRTVSFIRPR